MGCGIADTRWNYCQERTAQNIEHGHVDCHRRNSRNQNVDNSCTH